MMLKKKSQIPPPSFCSLKIKQSVEKIQEECLIRSGILCKKAKKSQPAKEDASTDESMISVETKGQIELETQAIPPFSSTEAYINSLLIYSGALDLKTPPKKIRFRKEKKQQLLKPIIRILRQSQTDKPIEPKNHTESKNVLVTGHPGCGKTLLIRRILDKIQNTGFNYFHSKHGIAKPVSLINANAPNAIHYFKTLDVNGMRMTSMAHLLETVHKFVGYSARLKKMNSESFTLIDKIKLRVRETPNVLYILFIDEVDYIYNKLGGSSTREEFYDLFRLANVSTFQNFLVISAANLIDFKIQLTKKSLSEEIPALETIIFEPYTKDQIYEIVQEKLDLVKQTSTPPCFSRQTLKHVTLTIINRENGDLRKVYSALKCIVEGKVTSMQRRKKEEEIKSGKEIICFEEVSDILSQRYSKGHQSIILGLSQYHQMTLVGCFLQLKRRTGVTVEDLLGSLNMIANELGFETISRDKLMEILVVLSNYSFVGIKEPEKKTGGSRSVGKRSVFQHTNETIVTLQIKMEELKEALMQFDLYREIIE